MNNIYNEDYIELVTRLRVARKNNGVTQLELANRLNVHQSFISKVENCERKLDVLEFFEWAKALEVPWKDLILNKYLDGEEKNSSD